MGKLYNLQLYLNNSDIKKKKLSGVITQLLTGENSFFFLRAMFTK